MSIEEVGDAQLLVRLLLSPEARYLDDRLSYDNETAAERYSKLARKLIEEEEREKKKSVEGENTMFMV